MNENPKNKPFDIVDGHTRTSMELTSARRQSVDAESDLLPGAVVAEQYEILEKIGKGGMGVVYKAHHRLMGRIVALKTLNVELIKDETSQRRFQHEAKHASLLAHRNVVTLHEFGFMPNGRPYLVFDFVQGTTLSQVVESGPMELSAFVDTFAQICDGIAYAHSKGLVHRDVKPSNILLVEDENGGRQVKVIDFGLAKSIVDKESLEKLTQTGDLAGSPLYMSPEQCWGHQLDPRTDIYSLGCVMYEAITGLSPFAGENPVQVILKQLYENTPGIIDPRVPDALKSIIERAMEKDRDNRYQSMNELKNDLVSLTAPPAIKRKPTKPPRSKKILFALAASVLLVGGIISVNTIFSADYHLLQGTKLWQEGKKQAAADEYKFALSLNPNLVAAREKMGGVLQALGQYDKAFENYSEAIKLKPSLAVGSYQGRGMIFAQRGDMPAAIKDYTKALSINPNLPDVLHNRASARVFSDVSGAIGDYSQALTLNSNRPDTLSGRGYAKFLSEDMEGAIRDFNEALKLNPNYALAYSNRAIVYMDLQRYREALSDLNEAVRLDGTSTSALNNRGFLKHLMGNDKDALNDLDLALKINPRSAAAYTSRGDVKYALGQKTAAIEDYDRALAINPRFVEALEHRADAISNSSAEVMKINPDRTPVQVVE